MTDVGTYLVGGHLTAAGVSAGLTEAMITGGQINALGLAQLGITVPNEVYPYITAEQQNALVAIPSTFIVVGPTGNDTTGKGSFAFPYLTIAKAITLWTATRHTIYVLAGDYAEVALVWPNVTGLSLIALGAVEVSNTDEAAGVLTIAPTFTASTFEATIKGPFSLAADTQIGLAIANADMTKKLNVYIDGLAASMDTSGDSIDIAGTVEGQAVRVYAKNMNLEGLLHFTANDAGSRLRVQNSELMGGITLAGAVAAEATLRNTQVLTSGVTKDGAWAWSVVGCVYATDADPAVYTELANAYDT